MLTPAHVSTNILRRLGSDSEERASYQIWRVYSGLTSDALKRWRFVAASIWIDDSGKHGPPVYVLGGYAANVLLWTDFADAWKEILNRPDPAPLAYLKAEEAFSLRKQFQGWSEKDRDERLLAFARLIERCELTGVEVVIRYEDFEELIKQNRGPFKAPPVFGVTCILTALLYAMSNFANPYELDFFFDKDSVKQGDLDRAYKVLHSGHQEVAIYMPNRPIMRDDKCWMPLQAADFYAWHVRRNHFEGGKLDTELWGVLKSRPTFDCGATRQEMLDMLAGLARRKWGDWPRNIPKPEPKRRRDG